MEIGDCFLLANKSVNDHAFIVISDPAIDAENVVIVSLTTARDYKDNSCLLTSDDHDWIKHDSVISYRDGKLVSEAKLDSLRKGSHLEFLSPVTDAVLDKIMAGAEITEELPGKCRRVLESQGFIGT